MTTLAHDDLKKILALHADWYWGREGGTRAVLTGADLTGADLTRADLTRAKLSDGVTWGDYLSEVVPALLVAGGKTLAEVATPDVWECHSWNNCPMHAAFGAKSIAEIPALHRWQGARFVQFFDARLIPMPVVPGADEETALATATPL